MNHSSIIITALATATIVAGLAFVVVPHESHVVHSTNEAPPPSAGSMTELESDTFDQPSFGSVKYHAAVFRDHARNETCWVFNSSFDTGVGVWCERDGEEKRMP